MVHHDGRHHEKNEDAWKAWEAVSKKGSAYVFFFFFGGGGNVHFHVWLDFKAARSGGASRLKHGSVKYETRRRIARERRGA